MVKGICFGFKAIIFLLLGLTFICREAVEGKSGKIIRKNNHSVKSIQSEDGDIIDCIDVYKQPAFDHPSLRNHIIQMKPSEDPTVETMTTNSNNEEPYTTSQLWQKSGSCPEGTIPVRRIRKKRLLKSNISVKDYGRKKLSFLHPELVNNKNLFLLQTNHSRAILIAEGFSYLGAKGDIKVYNPHVESDDEYSTSRVTLKSGPYYSFESVESGWAVNPSVYGDRQTRLFVYWTTDASNKTGCFDLTCPGFIQTNHEVALGAAIYPISTTRGLPYQITIYIFQDHVTGNWWVQYGEKINIGYWPRSLFRSLVHRAEGAEWGGEVYSTKLGQAPHTTTAMGSGRFPDWVGGTSGSIKRIRVRSTSGFLKFPDWVYNYADEYNCYDVQYVGDYIEDPEFYFGGPGQNPICP